MNEFQYAAPTCVDDAVGLIAEHGTRAKILAGGTDILVQLREGLKEADVVVDVKKVPELTGLSYSDQSGLLLGGAVPCWRIYEHTEIAAAYPALADAVRIIGGWQIQSRASVGGNLCNSSPAADSIPPLFVYDAVCHIAGPEGRRTVSVREFCTGPGQNILGAGELLVAIAIPPPAPRSSAAYQRFIPRNEMDIAVAGVASLVQLDETRDVIQRANIALAAVAPTPLLATDASESLVNKPADETSFAAAGELAQQLATPIDDMRGTAEYRKNLVGVLTKRTLSLAVQRARAQQN